ncbi:MAG: oxygenase MpaB family protein [Sphingopyxis sp.]|uniref:oxygenase MpaB family protein n=1 Tax=Sphingopyxis sp. TaxID=1908224 RepID=UPI002AB8CB17|nr:oxygenase MpaB family protein [Sphingopyxis sp.]MDZ3830269.1 oxygenase MpaB family protein [Sphingopyxis sp.]
MNSNVSMIAERVRGQADALPELFGRFDFDRAPERWAPEADATSELGRLRGVDRGAYLHDDDLVGRIREYTMLGDRTGDAYAALMPRLGFQRTVAMLVEACDRGVDAVADAPPELVALIREMEARPDWLDMDLVEAGAAYERNATANLAPFLIRGAFIATFLNKYSALPMALTGTLGHTTAARRVKETATFFATTALPGALERFGAGFKAAAMVRLMHSMVRVNLLSRPGMWDADTYGVPIPQLDQMPAGLIPIYFLSQEVLKKGRCRFNRVERGRVELARYRCYLLGLPEDLLADTPQEIVRIWRTRSATLRYEYDDAICGALLRATMDAELSKAASPAARVKRRLERSTSRVFFVKAFLNGDAQRAEGLGVPVGRRDRLVYGATMLGVAGRMAAYRVASRLPVVRHLADRRLIHRIERQLAGYGHAEFTSDAADYRPATAR